MITKITAASGCITEDYLKATIGKSHGNKAFNPHANNNLPKNLDSCFGNFPAKSRIARPNHSGPVVASTSANAVAERCKFQNNSLGIQI